MEIIGRKKEQDKLMSLYHSDKSEFVAIYGRRRVGKTYLVNTLFEGQFAFKHTGLSPYDDEAGASLADQLLAFNYSLIRYGQSDRLPAPKSWLEAFFRLEQLLSSKADGKKQVVFIDELPWMDTPRSKFVMALESFYNGWASGRHDILLIICGSSSSWILKNIVNNKGGLYDRLTCQMKLVPFTLKETEDFLRAKGVDLDRYDIVRLSMAFGGIPYYLGYVKPGMSAEQIIDDAIFQENASLEGEFKRLFATLFDNAETYIKIVRVLATRNYGYTRSEISDKSGISAGGGLSNYLEKLCDADFVEAYRPILSKSREEYYRLKDFFCIFWLRFKDGKKGVDAHFWQNNSGTAKVLSWQGVAFEQICIAHLESIRQALGISGVQTQASNLIIPSERGGGQIDLVIARADRHINLCEMKFYSSKVSVDQQESLKIRHRKNLFMENAKIKGSVFLTLVTTFGLTYGTYSGTYQQVLTLDDLFRA